MDDETAKHVVTLLRSVAGHTQNLATHIEARRALTDGSGIADMDASIAERVANIEQFLQAAHAAVLNGPTAPARTGD